MQLSYLADPFSQGSKRVKVRARITTAHSASSYGQPVIVLPDGGALDLMSWVGCGYRVERATLREQHLLEKMGLTV